jgi:hypothetical protein
MMAIRQFYTKMMSTYLRSTVLSAIKGGEHDIIQTKNDSSSLLGCNFSDFFLSFYNNCEVEERASERERESERAREN